MNLELINRLRKTLRHKKWTGTTTHNSSILKLLLIMEESIDTVKGQSLLEECPLLISSFIFPSFLSSSSSGSINGGVGSLGSFSSIGDVGGGVGGNKKNQEWQQLTTSQLSQQRHHLSGQVDWESERICHSHQHRLRDAVVVKSSLRSVSTSDNGKSQERVSVVKKHVSFSRERPISYPSDKTEQDLSKSWYPADMSEFKVDLGPRKSDLHRKRNNSVGFRLKTASAVVKSEVDVGWSLDRKVTSTPTTILEKRNGHRQAILHEQEWQLHRGVRDAETLSKVSLEHSQWSKELARSRWWLHQTTKQKKNSRRNSRR